MYRKVGSLDKLNNILRADFKVYSFDIFDTMIYRLLPPEYLKVMTCEFILRKYPLLNKNITSMDIYLVRREIELNLESESVNRGLERDYRFTDCIKELVNKLTGNYNSNTINEIIEYEISLEIACIKPVPGVEKILSGLKKRKSRIICISDMYLGESIVSRILDSKGLMKYIDKIYISSDYGKRKNTGNLYNVVIENELVKAAEMIHIGDNHLSDCEMAQKAGLNTVYYHNSGESARYSELEKIVKPEKVYETGINFINESLKHSLYHGSEKNSLHLIAGRLALPLISYVESIIASCRENEIKHVYFLSREGLFFKKIFDVLKPDDIESHYLSVSRMSLFMLTFNELNDNTIDTIIDYFENHSYTAEVSISQITYMLKIDTKETRSIIKSYGFNPDESLKINVSKGLIKNVLSDIMIKNIFSRKRAEYSELFFRYLDSVELLSHGKILISDMGWSGSMQTYLEKILQRERYNIEIHGYYFGYDKTVDEKKHKTRGDNSVFKKGYIQYNGDDKLEYREKNIINNITLELIAAAPHGTVLGYREEGNIVVPEYSDYRIEISQYKVFAAPIQDYILEYASDSKDLLKILFSLFSYDEMLDYNLNDCYDFFSNPDRASASAVSRLVFFDDFFGKRRKIKFNDILWWEGAYKLLGKDIAERSRLSGSRDKAFKLLKKYSLFNRMKKLFSQVKKSPSVSYLRSLNRRFIKKKNELKFIINFYGFTRYLKLKLFKIYRHRDVNDREFKILKQYTYHPAHPEKNTSIKKYVFLSKLKRLNKYKVQKLIKEVHKQSCPAADIIIVSKKNCYHIEINSIRDYTITRIELSALKSIINRFDYCITTGEGIVLDREFLQSVNSYISGIKNPHMIYCDNDTIIGNHYYSKPKFKTDWSLYTYLEYDYIGRVVILNSALVAGNLDVFLRPFYEDSTRSAVLSILEKIQGIFHLKEILYHDPVYDFKNNVEYVNGYLNRRGLNAAAEKISQFICKIVFNGDAYGKVSVIIPFKDKSDYLIKCIDSLTEKTEYKDYELILVNNRSEEEKTAAYLSSIENRDKIKIIDYDHPFNFSAMNNYAVEKCTGDYIIFLNNDTEIIDGFWIHRMLDYAHLDHVGCVGARLFYPDGRIQHGGIIFDFNDVYPARNQFAFESGTSAGYLNRLETVQKYSGVAAACLMMKRKVFIEIGGYDEKYQIAYNDLDLCCRAVKNGYDVIWNPHVKLIHYEYISRGNPSASKQDIFERDMFVKQWGPMFADGDPYYTKHLDLEYNMRG